MSEHTVYSYSRLSAYNTCPYQYRAKYVTKEVVFDGSEATRWGSSVHEAAENMINGEAVSERYDFLKPHVDAVKAKQGKITAEHEVAITTDNKATVFNDPTALMRGRIDVLIDEGHRAQILDWKTNKKTNAGLMPELECFSWMLMTMRPEVEKINNVLIWLTTGDKPTTKMLTRADLPKLDDTFRANIDKVEHDLTFDNFKKKKSGLCKAYCPVHSCQHNGMFK